jgi:fatty-acid desaturase
MTTYSKDSFLLLSFQLAAHIGLVYQILHGTIEQWVVTLAVYFVTGCFGMTMTYHRLLSHKSWNAPHWFERFGTLCGFYGLTGSSIAWVAIHREHHRHTDKDGDPHAPGLKGFFAVQWLSMFEKPNPKYALHLVKDSFHMKLHNYYFILHAAIACSLWLTIGLDMMIAVYLAPAAILWNAGSFINTLTHMVGYRNHHTQDNSTNIWWLGYIMWGEGWHNNHHAHPSNANFSERWWELDIGGIFIKLLRKN